MKRLHILLFLFFILVFVGKFHAQQAQVDSLYNLYSKTIDDTTKVNLLIEIANAYAETDC